MVSKLVVSEYIKNAFSICEQDLRNSAFLIWCLRREIDYHIALLENYRPLNLEDDQLCSIGHYLWLLEAIQKESGVQYKEQALNEKFKLITGHEIKLNYFEFKKQISNESLKAEPDLSRILLN